MKDRIIEFKMNLEIKVIKDNLGWLQETLANFVAFSWFFEEYFKIRKMIFMKFKNMAIVYTFKTKVTSEGNS